MSLSLVTVDVGNTRAKWARFEGSRLVGDGTLREGEPLPQALERGDIEVLGLAVTGDEAAAARVLTVLGSVLGGARVVRVRTERRFDGLVNSYADPERMGVDRWLAMLGAWAEVRSALCVLDVGTALTVDVVAGDGCHSGGWIVPGEALMRSVLGRETARVGSHAAAEDAAASGWGQSTAACVSLGCRAAELAAARAGVASFRDSHPEGQIFLTGGGAERLAGAIGEADGSVRIDPALVHRGLAHRLLDAGAPCSSA